MTQLTEEQFLREIATHQMHILHEDGVYRHIRFQRPGTVCMHFDLITYPGFLVYSGDMGCYVFSRLHDMFEFFRTDREYAHRRGRKLVINPGYWSEKLQADDSNNSRANRGKEYSAEQFRAAVWSDFLAWVRYRGASFAKEQRRDLWEQIKSEVLDHEHDEHAAYNAANDFRWRADGRPWYEDGARPEFEFVDFWDHNLTDYTHRFLWCCYALAWGIEQFDQAKDLAAKEAA